MNREELLQAMSNGKVTPQPLEVSFGTVYYIPINRVEFDHCQALMLKAQKEPSADRLGAMRFQILSHGWVTEDGTRVLDPKSKADRDLFDTFKAGDSELICEAIMTASKITKEDQDFLLNG